MGKRSAAERLREHRVSRGQLLSDLADALGCTKGWLSLIERGLGAPGRGLANAIEDATGISHRDWPVLARKQDKRSAA
jgi:transcriptional regulator with XRE-family HTH domain